MKKADLVVVGGGPGGYASALRASQKGAKVILVEKKKLGGTCLNVGCVPTKVLAKTAELYSQTAQLSGMGIVTGPVSLNFAAVQNRKGQVVETLSTGVAGLLSLRGVECLQGEAGIPAPGRVSVKGEGGELQELEAGKIIVATGSRPMELPGMEFDGELILNSTQALELEEVPASLLVVGGGVVGLEFASIFSQFGSKVTVVELLPGMLPFIDGAVVSALEQELTAKGVTLHKSTRLTGVEKGAGGVKAALQCQDKTWQVEVEKILIAAGRLPNGDIGKSLGITRDHAIPVNAKMETGCQGVYAVGDVTGNYALAYVAYHEALAAAENALGGDIEMDYRFIPQTIFTSPEVAGIGLTEEEARKKHEIVTGVFPFSANGKALAAGSTTGFVKLIAEKKYGEVLGAFIIGPAATELIHQVAMAMRLEATLDDLCDMIHGHPTLSEAINEAGFVAMQKPLHFV